jgi:hypothetical protein
MKLIDPRDIAGSIATCNKCDRENESRRKTCERCGFLSASKGKQVPCEVTRKDGSTQCPANMHTKICSGHYYMVS